MEDSLLFVLSPDVEFIPVNSLNNRTKSHFQHDESDVVITHFHTRKSSKVIDFNSAELLKEFKSPKTWAEVIFNFASVNNKDESGFLVHYNESITKGTVALFGINDRFKQFVITKIIKVLDDTEVYFGKDGSGKNFVLKFIDKSGSNDIPNEVRILKKLDGRVNPILTDDGYYLDKQFMITERFESTSCIMEAARYRNYDIRENVVKALDLCINILKAYRHLHKQGILHGDINDQNVLISKSGSVKIIDFNAAVHVNQDSRPGREGVCYYYEPELAYSRLNNTEDIPPTEKGEQYALAAVLYFMLSGRHYTHFSIENEKLYHQILKIVPVTFSEYDLNLPKELDIVFARALSKNPLDRFNSLSDFVEEMIKIRNNVFLSNNFFIHNKSHSEEKFIHYLIEKYGRESEFLRKGKGLSLAPTCSVNYGAAGIAYMFYRMACIREDTHLLDLADIWANRSTAYISDYRSGFYSNEIEINEFSVGRCSIYHSPSGVHLVQCLISSCKGDHLSLYRSMDQFILSAKEPCDKIDLACGKAGLLVGFAILFKDMSSIRNFDAKSIIISANTIMDELWKNIDQFPQVKKATEVDYLGIAHGWSGLLYATLYWCSVSGQILPKHFMDRVEQLENCFIEKNAMIYWPIKNDDPQTWPGWCNGNSGQVFFWSLLYKYSMDEKYLDIAERTARYIIQDKSSRNYNLCCGMAGQAYALLNLHNLTGEKIYIEHALGLKQGILEIIASPSERINSLYKSTPGAGVLFCELERSALARMPLFE
jgi:eukaryotic-like serine/threonine-protein kinase